MKNKVLPERELQKHFLNELETKQGYLVRKDKNYDKYRALDPEMLFQFLWTTQPEEMEKLKKIYKNQLEETILNRIQQAECQPNQGRLYLLKHGMDINNTHLTFMFTKPATDFNKKLNEQYKSNVFSAIEEVWASDKERVDLVVFLNGFAVASFELKSTTSGQSYHHAIAQYRKERNPRTRLFNWKAGALVFFAMDEQDVYMTTRLSGSSTYFLPFNKGNGEDVNAGAGNPIAEDGYSTSYMWEDILSRDTLIEIIHKFMFEEISEKKDPVTEKKTTSRTIIFPRYHQLDVVRKLISDVKVNHSDKNYLIQHSAGSGKTNSLAWLSHRLASLHDKDNQQIFDNIIICTDRVVVDRQLQAAIQRLDHKAGMIKVMDDDCTSADLADALKSNTKIIATTIQKFPYIMDDVKNLKNKRFAVIIDEAHSSTAGKNMAAVTRTLGSEDDSDLTMEDAIDQEIRTSGKQPNVSVFAFTATPKATTLELFGQIAPDGTKQPFHIYSMRQAIEEGFILDVLQNYTTYGTFVKLNKAIEEDPEYETVKAKRQIARFIELDDTNINQRVEIIIEHFRTTVMPQLRGTAKAMVVTPSCEAAVKYQKAFERYIKRKGYEDIRSLVAFSGKVKLEEDDKEYTEPGMNGFSEKKLPSEFEKDENKVLIVADKYQTGFDQKRLSAMYVLKKLKGISAVQTLSRLNRVCPSEDKRTFVLDFKNDYEDIKKAFEKYYTVTFLSNSVTPADIHELMAKLEGYDFLDFEDIERFNELLYKPEVDASDRGKMKRYLERAKKKIEKLAELEGDDILSEIKKKIRNFIRFYQFLLQATCYKDEQIHKTYNFLSPLSNMLKSDDGGPGFSLKGEIEMVKVRQRKGDTHVSEPIHSDPVLRLPKADSAFATEDKQKKLSDIIREINERFGNHFADDAAFRAMMSVIDELKKSDALKRSAATNSFDDFAKYAVANELDEALTESLDQNYAFLSLLLNNDDYKQRIIDIYTDEIYKQLKKESEK